VEVIMNKFFWRSTLSLSVLAMAAGGVACGGTSGTVETPSTATTNTVQAAAATTGPVAANSHGQVKLIGEALGEVGLRPDQRTQLEQLAADAETRHAAVQAAHKDLMLAIAAQIESGTIDRAALQPKIDAATAAWKASRPADRAAFEKIHSILDASQRAEFIESLRTKAQAKMGGGPGHGHGGGFLGGHGRLAKLADDLQLTDAQRDQVKAIMKDERHEHAGAHPFQDGKQRMDTVLDAFKQDRFVIDDVAPMNAAQPDHANGMAMHMLDIAERMQPILTPAQQKLAAEKLRERANDTHEAEMIAPAPL
jgi:Spy/CpxP family protein refolding chaperone